jgi:opacity protein-like surface antigen
MLEVTLTGSLEERFSQFKTNQRRSWGAEVLVPIASFLQLSAGHTFLEDKDTFNSEYREFQSERGVALPPGAIESIETYIDSTVNGVLFQTLGYVRPSIFGGALWRTYCEENSLADYGCIEQDLSWNAGAGLSMRVTNNLRLGITYRVTPSVTHKKDKRLDTLTSLSLTITF